MVEPRHLEQVVRVYVRHYNQHRLCACRTLLALLRRTAATISLVSFERQRFGAARRFSAMRLLRRHR
jgi:hypothetical protein